MKLLNFCFFLFSYFVSAQSLTVSSESYISISNNSSISVDGLQLTPSATYVVAGPNTFDRSSSPIVVGDNTSINRVYTMTSELYDFLGIVTFSYEDSELNGISEVDLVLEVQDSNGIWNNVSPSIEETNNTLTYDFTEFVSLTTVTASSVNGTLSVDPLLVYDNVKVYPNPATNAIFIKSNLNYQSTLYNAAGQRVLESNAKQLNVIDLPNGVYVLHLKSDNNTKSTFKIIKK